MQIHNRIVSVGMAVRSGLYVQFIERRPDDKYDRFMDFAILPRVRLSISLMDSSVCAWKGEAI
jgi:hypothetical protein